MIETRKININGVPTEVKWDTVLDGPCFTVPDEEREVAPQAEPAPKPKPKRKRTRSKSSTPPAPTEPVAATETASTSDALPGDTEPAS